MKTQIGVALIFAGTFLVISPFAYYLWHLSIEMEAVTRSGQRTAGINYGPFFGFWQAALGVLGLLMIISGVFGTCECKLPGLPKKKAAPPAE